MSQISLTSLITVWIRMKFVHIVYNVILRHFCSCEFLEVFGS